MDLVEVIFLAILTFFITLSYGIILIRKDIDELKELIDKKL